jgi:hypothetical protein
MDSSLIPFFVILTLVIVTFCSWRVSGLESRTWACIAVFLSTLPGYLIYETQWYFPIVDALGSYGYQSATPLLAIVALSFIRDKLASVLMCLFSMLILANGYFWMQEGNAQQIQAIQQAIVWAVFIIEIALMLSPRLTNGIHRAIQRFNLARNIAKIGYSRNHRSHSSKANIGKNQS